MIVLSSIDNAVRGSAGIPVAFIVGVISFFTPCVLPLVPGYLSYVSGISAQELEEGTQRSRVLFATLLFVLGFAIMFMLLGASFGALSTWLIAEHRILGLSVTAKQLSGVFVILMGLIFLSSLGVRRFVAMSQSETPFVRRTGKALTRVGLIFSTERGFHSKKPKAGLVGAVPLGAAFAISWTPCVGPGMGAILTLAANQGGPGKGAVLLFFFSLGFGVWFILGALGFKRMMKVFRAVRSKMKYFVAFGGAFMIAIGVLIVTNHWDQLFAPLKRWFIV
ncbi:MAG: cytochrome c biogenesis CcdA family protein [Actinomycetota bacterium]